MLYAHLISTSAMRHDHGTKIVFITSYEKENDYDHSLATLEFRFQLCTISGTNMFSWWKKMKTFDSYFFYIKDYVLFFCDLWREDNNILVWINIQFSLFIIPI